MNEELNKIIKELLLEMKFMDTTIKGVSDSEEYKNNCCYNDGIRKAVQIIKSHKNKNLHDDSIGGINMSDAKINGIIFEHDSNDFGLWEGFVLSEEDENAIWKILSKYDAEGCSVRGTRKEIAEEIGE